MSFLTSILARAAGLAPAVQPRLPSRYEKDGAADLVEVAAETPAAAVAAAPRMAAPQREEVAEAPAPAPAPVPQSHAVAAPSPFRSAAPQAPLSERRLRRRTPKEEPPATTITTPQQPLLPVAPPESREEAPPASEPLVIREEAPLRMLIQSRETTHIVDHARELMRETIRERSGEAPTIRVTIGRIDVRAATEPAPEKREAPKRAVFTIEDYIRLRKEGRR